jgi:hypothetical protein
MKNLSIDEALKRELAVQASCHPKTIAKVLRGEPVRGLAGHRARKILEAAGLLPHPDEAVVGSK